MTDLNVLTDEIRQFRDERDWAQYHTPPQLANALSIETAELQELFLWLDENEAAEKLEDEGLREEARREIADVLIYALLFCHELGIDPEEAIKGKLQENAEKYPADIVRGKAEKYTEYDQGEEGQ